MARVKKYLSFLFGWCLIVVVIVFSIQTMALNANFYTKRYEKMNLSQEIQVSDADLDQSIIMLMDYLEDRRSDLNNTIVWKGHTQSTFNKKEIRHMVDVKNLYQNVKKVSVIAIVVLLGILFYMFYIDRRKAVAFLTKGVIRATVCLGIFVIVIGMWMVTDFTSFWTWFHIIFFSNDLWLLNPNTDFMICMLPETIFNQLVGAIVWMIVFVLLPILIGCIYYQRKKAPIGFEEDNE